MDKMTECYAIFDFDESRYLVRYWTDRNIGDEIEDAITNLDFDDVEYEDVVHDIMDSFNVSWEIVPCRKYVI